MQANDFQFGDVLEFTQVSRRDGKDFTEYRTAIVTSVDESSVCYRGYRIDHRLESGSGFFSVDKVGASKYGFHVAVKKIGHNPGYFQRPWSPKPGDTGYDLMC